MLYRLDTDHGDAVLRVQTTASLLIHTLPADYAHAVAVERISWSEDGIKGQRVRFLVDANATKTIRKAGQRGKRVPLQAQEMIAWWERQACQAGLATVAVCNHPLRPVIAGRAMSNPISLQATRFEGVAVVTDPAALQRAVLSGIGRGRAYGLGLLCVNPAGADSPGTAATAALTSPDAGHRSHGILARCTGHPL
ncbi:type I-E CRISPR-associated protein Cas6/Cse3/CasE [Streptomyces sp. NPDC046939]|uniref:type I-E CRISPR-associated protein Cas6/Cse3/CasE n=1 Tax=Streptomyces sp. NPDC046939 TaxID=3155376 RepID=UPI0033E76528